MVRQGQSWENWDAPLRATAHQRHRTDREQCDSA
jgi:hypothetical protein